MRANPTRLRRHGLAVVVAAGVCVLPGVGTQTAQTARAGTAAPPAGSVAVIVVPRFSPAEYEARGAVGLFVPGAGSTASGERARASLVRGRVISSLVGLDGTVKLQLSRTPAETTIYLALPPPGPSHNVVRYPIAIVGPGYRGLLVSGSTRIPGLVSLADVAPTAEAIEGGKPPVIRARPDTRAAATLATLDTRLTRAHDARTGATLTLVGWLVAFSSLGILARSALAGRAAVLTAPCALGIAIALRAVGVDGPPAVITALGLLTGALALLLAWRPSLLAPAVIAFLAGLLVVLWHWPDVNALAAIGPHPDGGGRFYGVTNQVETMLLVPSLAAAGLAGAAGAAVIGVMLLVVVGWSRSGADGGGVVVVVASFAALMAALSRVRLTPARLVVGAGTVVAVGLGVIALDRLLGGSSHVTDALGGGPGALLDDLGRRLRISWEGATTAFHTAFLCLLSLGGLAWLGIRGRRSPAVVAMLVAIGVSLLVNDSPVDVLGYGALGCLALTAWDETRALSRCSRARSLLRVPRALRAR